MATKKVTDLDPLTSVANDDLVMIVDVSDTTGDANGTSKKIEVSALQSSSGVTSVNTQTGVVVLDADDIDDTSTTNKYTNAADITKLSGIETGAEVNPTASEIKTSYESNADTNAYTDAEKTKLSGIATGAEVNVNADWNAATGDAQILNKPTIPSDPAVENNAGTPVLATGITQGEMQSVLNVDPAGTDNSTDATVGATASDVLKMAAGQALGAFDAGSDKLVFWDDSDSKLTYATIGTNLTMTGTTLSAAGGGGGGGNGGGNFMMVGFTTTTTNQWYSFYLPYDKKFNTSSGAFQYYQQYTVPAAGSITKVAVNVQGAVDIKFGVMVNPSGSTNNVQAASYTYEYAGPTNNPGANKWAITPTNWTFPANAVLCFAFYNVDGGTPFYISANVHYEFS